MIKSASAAPSITRTPVATPITPLSAVETTTTYKAAALKAKVAANPDASVSFDLGLTKWTSGERALQVWRPYSVNAEWAQMPKAATSTFANEPHVFVQFPVVTGTVAVIDYEVYQATTLGWVPSDGNAFPFLVAAPQMVMTERRCRRRGTSSSGSLPPRAEPRGCK